MASWKEGDVLAVIHEAMVDDRVQRSMAVAMRDVWSLSVQPNHCGTTQRFAGKRVDDTACNGELLDRIYRLGITDPLPARPQHRAKRRRERTGLDIELMDAGPVDAGSSAVGHAVGPGIGDIYPAALLRHRHLDATERSRPVDQVESQFDSLWSCR